jgi:glycosyltransferase involved in cell wall biosynthesis
MRVVHITLYPPKGEKHVRSSGVASYAKNLVTGMGSDTSVEQIVLSEKTSDEVSEDEEDDIRVIRCFERNVKFVWQLHRQLKRLEPDAIHIQQELALYGGIVTAYALQWLVAMHRKRTVITLHGVLSLRQITADFVRQNNYKLPVWMIKLGLLIIYKPLIFWARKVIVHEPPFKQVLIREYSARPDSVEVVPHGVEDFRVINQSVARETLGLGKKANVVLFMGYASGYKGIDLLIEGFAEHCKSDRHAYLIIGAGKNPKLAGDASYQRTYESYQQKAARLIPDKQYRWVGFIDEHDIGTYYSAADVSVYPYTTALSSSGPMSIAIGHERPFLASDSFSSVFSRRVLFRKTPTDMADRLHKFFLDPKDFQAYSRQLKAERVWPQVSETTLELYRSMQPGSKEVVTDEY